MKKSFVFILTTSFFLSSNAVLASTFDAQCLTSESKLKKCTLNVDSESFRVDYKSDKYQDLDLDKGNISKLAHGAYAKQNFGDAALATLLLGPIGLLGLLSKKKGEQIAIEYADPQGQKKAVLIDIKKSQAFPFRQELEALTGLAFQKDETQED